MPKDAPEGYVYDGTHLVEAGLGTYHPVYTVDGRVQGAIHVPFPLECVECGKTRCQHDVSWYKREAKRKRGS